jgi:hypothetical protein
MKPRWYFIKGHELRSRVYLLSAHPLELNQYVKLREGLGFIERHRDGSWLCYVHGRYVGFEPTAQYAAVRIEMELLKHLKKENYYDSRPRA